MRCRSTIGLALGIVTAFLAVRAASQTPGPGNDAISNLPPPENRWALVIGVGKYNDEAFQPLAGDRDAKIIAKALVKYGGYPRDQVKLLVNDNKNPHYHPTYESINYWLNEIAKRTSTNDVWLIAFSGHGIHLDPSPGSPGGDFLVPSDATVSDDPYYLTSQMISIETIKGYLSYSGVRQTIILLDFCRDNFSPLNSDYPTNTLAPTIAHSLDFEKTNSNIRAAAVLFATSINHSAYQDQPNSLGFFSEYFVNGLAGEANDSDGSVTLSSLINYIHKEVPARVHHQFFEKHLDQISKQIPDTYVFGYNAKQLKLTQSPTHSVKQVEQHPALALAAEPIEQSDDVSGPVFSSPRDFSVGGVFPNSVAVGDFNGDGKLDIVTANSDTNDVSVLLGNGDGSFQLPARRYSAGEVPYSIAVGDFNGDGKLDVAVANIGYQGHPSISILLGRGDGTFEDATNFPSNDQPTKLLVADLNRDHKLDLVVGNKRIGAVSVLLGNGDGTFQLPVSYPVDSVPYSVAGGYFTVKRRGQPGAGDDTDPNLKFDLVVANNGDHSLSVLLGNGDGTFPPADNYPVDTGRWGPYAVQVGDFDSDGIQDLVITDFSNNGIGLLIGNGDGTFQGRTVPFRTDAEPFDLVIADFNGDNKLDVATANNSNSVSVLLGNGDGTFQSAKTYSGESSPCSIAVGDFNGDGRPDLVTANRAGDSVSILLNISNQTNLMLTSSQNPSHFDASVKFSARVLTDFGSATGYVVFKSDAYILGRIPLEDGVATVDTYALEPGSHLITARFVGSAQFGGSAAGLTQQVVASIPLQAAPK